MIDIHQIYMEDWNAYTVLVTHGDDLLEEEFYWTLEEVQAQWCPVTAALVKQAYELGQKDGKAKALGADDVEVK